MKKCHNLVTNFSYLTYLLFRLMKKYWQVDRMADSASCGKNLCLILLIKTLKFDDSR